MIDQLIRDFSGSIKAHKIKKILNSLRDHRPGLVFDEPFDREVLQTLQTIAPGELFAPEKIVHKDFANAVVSGFYIWNENENEAHTLAQNLNTAEGSYFHAIVHRREPDIWNSNYWFNRTGNHPVFPLVYDFVQMHASPQLGARLLKNKNWDPGIFNEIVGEAQTNGNTSDDELTAIQHAELLFLIAHSYRHTIGS